MSQFKTIFDKKFSNWKIALSQHDVDLKRSGIINESGWFIHYLFGNDGGSEYIEYFASHRMTNDTLNRIYEDGREELVNAVIEFFPAGDENERQAYERHNREFYLELQEKGLA